MRVRIILRKLKKHLLFLILLTVVVIGCSKEKGQQSKKLPASPIPIANKRPQQPARTIPSLPQTLPSKEVGEQNAQAQTTLQESEIELMRKNLKAYKDAYEMIKFYKNYQQTVFTETKKYGYGNGGTYAQFLQNLKDEIGKIRNVTAIKQGPRLTDIPGDEGSSISVLLDNAANSVSSIALAAMAKLPGSPAYNPQDDLMDYLSNQYNDYMKDANKKIVKYEQWIKKREKK